MKAPERLYLSKNIYSTFLYQIPDPDDETSVEYIRIDAFIEKACEYINKSIDIPHNIECADNGDPLANSYINYAKERLEVVNKIIEEFKNYMKGE